MSTILTAAIVQNANNSVTKYISTINQLNSELDGVIKGLQGNQSFIGDASNGYSEFYTSKILPAITDNLVAEGSSLTASIKMMMENIQTQLLNTVDPQLGDNNRNPG